MNLKAFARFLYANVPGAAAARFGAMDLAAGHFDKPEYGGVVPLAIDGGLIVDIGANRGQSIAAFRALSPRSRIVAFEPEPRSAERLSARYRGAMTVAIHACALGSQAGSVIFFVPSYGRWGCDGMSATSREAATSWLEDPNRMFHFDKAKLTVEEHPVECRTLDSFELAPRLIKLHAQGAEPDILKGSQLTIQRHRPALMCAFPVRQVGDLIFDLGYRPYVFHHGIFSRGIARPPVSFTWFLTDEHTRRVPLDDGLPNH